MEKKKVAETLGFEFVPEANDVELSEILESNIYILAWSPLFFSAIYFSPLWLLVTVFGVSVSAVSWFLVEHGGKPYPVPPAPYSSVYDFKVANQDSCLLNNAIQGISMIPWFSLLRRYWRYIDWKIYWKRVLAVTAMSIFNSIIGIYEDIRFGEKVRKQKVSDEPVFVFGHPRTGTTMLHNMLAKNEKKFHFPNTFQCGFPNGMLTLEKYTYLFDGAIGETRPMDNMKLGFDTPQEDELATNVLSAGISPYMPLTFMKAEPEFRRYFSFERASQEDTLAWMQSFMLFFKKYTLSNDPDLQRRPVIKSPVHTARGKLLHKMFPKGQIIYIHRNPYRVFLSASNMAQKTYYYMYLGVPTKERIQDFIINQYVTLFDDYMAAKKVLPKECLIEISYEEITSDLVGTMKKIYDYFKWDGWEAMEAIYKKEAESMKSFQKNSFIDMDPKLKELVYEKWKDSFDAFGYEK